MSQIDYLRTRLPIPTSHCSGPHASHNLALTCGRLRRVGNKNPSPYLHLFRRGCIALAAHRSQQEHCALHRAEQRMDCPHSARNCAASRRVRSKSQFVLRRGVSSWGQHQSFRVLEPSKPADRRVGRPTHLSAMFSQTSASSYFGLKIQRLVSLLRLIAACAKPSAFSVAIVNGQATPKPQSSLKFYDGKRCAT